MSEFTSNCLAGKGSWICWGRATSLDGGDPTTDTHQPFNPMESVSVGSGKYAQKQITTFDKLVHNIEYSSQFEEFEMTFTCYFRDPMMLEAAMGYKTMTTSWTGTGDVITGAFTTLANLDKNIWVRIHAHDQSGNADHIDQLLDGGGITKYKWSMEAGGAIMEEVTIKFTSLSFNATALDIDTGFDDSSFDVTGAAEVSTIVAKAAASIGDGDYFFIQGIAATTNIRTDYYVWFDQQGAEQADPAPSGYTKITCDISGDTTAQDVSDEITSKIAAVGNFGAANGSGTSTTITVTNANNGDVKDIVDLDSTLTLATTTQGAVAVDGGWGMWDGAYGSDDVAEAKDVTITWNSAAFVGLALKSVDFEFDTSKERWFKLSSLNAAGGYFGKIPPIVATVKGVVDDNDNIFQPSTIYSSKTLATFKILYGTTKYLQSTLMYVDDFSTEIPQNGKAMEGTYILHGGANFAISYSWTANEATDPESHINHTNV